MAWSNDSAGEGEIAELIRLEPPRGSKQLTKKEETKIANLIMR